MLFMLSAMALFAALLFYMISIGHFIYALWVGVKATNAAGTLRHRLTVASSLFLIAAVSGWWSVNGFEMAWMALNVVGLAAAALGLVLSRGLRAWQPPSFSLLVVTAVSEVARYSTFSSVAVG